MNLPNLLTLSRLGLVAVMMVLLASSFPYAKSMAMMVFVVAGITDYLDGYIARKFDSTTSFGKLMDPLTDKIMVCAAFVSFVGIQVNAPNGMISLVPAWLVVIIISREFLVTGLRLLAATRGNIISAGRWGKHKTGWQIVAIIVLLLGLAIRSDLLDQTDKVLLKNYDFAFSYIAFAVSVAVALITVTTGGMYYVQHRELISQGR